LYSKKRARAHQPQKVTRSSLQQQTTNGRLREVIGRLALQVERGGRLSEAFREFPAVFTPLQMTSVADSDAAALPAEDPTRYKRYALGPLREAPKEGKGWLFAAGELAMPARDLAKQPA